LRNALFAGRASKCNQTQSTRTYQGERINDGIRRSVEFERQQQFRPVGYRRLRQFNPLLVRSQWSNDARHSASRAGKCFLAPEPGSDPVSRRTHLCQPFSRSKQHINAMEITPDKQHLAVASYQKIKLYDVHCKTTNPVIQFESILKNVTAVGFQEDGRWMYSGGEDGYARVWDMRSQNYQCQKMYLAKNPVNCAALHPNQTEIYLGDQGGVIYIWDLRSSNYRKMQVDNDIAINHLSIEPYGNCLAAVDNKGNCYTFSLNVKYANTQLANKIDVSPAAQTVARIKVHSNP
jgi:WD40 repeat protein